MKKETLKIILELLLEENEQDVKDWIREKWPRGYDLYD